MNTKIISAIIILALFLGGSGYFLYRDRPVMELKNTTELASNAQVGSPNTSDTRERDEYEVDEDGDEDQEIQPADATSPQPSTPQPPSQPTSPQPTAPTPSGYTIAIVQTHNTPSDCWATISGSVYDLTTWISRHPGGEAPIKALCGTDATARFEAKHGGSKVAKASLALLKIGDIQ